jgi:hypothetical protein
VALHAGYAVIEWREREMDEALFDDARGTHCRPPSSSMMSDAPRRLPSTMCIARISNFANITHMEEFFYNGTMKRRTYQYFCIAKSVL